MRGQVAPVNGFWCRYRESLTRTFDFSGRTSLDTFNTLVWSTQVVLFVGLIAAISVNSEKLTDRLIIGLIVVALVMLIPQIAAAVRRLHDRGRSGRSLWLILVPLANLWVVYELFQPGDDHPNRFGRPPDN